MSKIKVRMRARTGRGKRCPEDLLQATSNLVGPSKALSQLKAGISAWILSLRRVPAADLEQHHKGPGVYVIFYNGQPARVGSTIAFQTRIPEVLEGFRLWLAGKAAEDRGISVHGARCQSCGQRMYEAYSIAFHDFLKTFKIRLDACFIPTWILRNVHMETRQFEGLAIWALTPPLNTPHEIESLGRQQRWIPPYEY